MLETLFSCLVSFRPHSPQKLLLREFLLKNLIAELGIKAKRPSESKTDSLEIYNEKNIEKSSHRD